MKKQILTLTVLALTLTLFSCAEIKSAGRTVGHTTKEVTTEIGHTTKDVTTKIGHASRDAVKSVGEEISD
ncbi:MAG: hypothetical protein ACJAT7_002559 [Psychromonas sp.]|jgi:hypothetical protein|uniref:hypothetical protein n=1 Tax=Psychromonas sp. TaxID=1884585 RepID=UPI0039E64027